MNSKLPDIRKVNIKDKRVFLRLDLDVALAQQTRIIDDSRLVASLPTIKYLLNHGARVIIGGHLGRPKGVDKSLSLEPVVVWLCENIKDQKSNIKNGKWKIESEKLNNFDGWKLSKNLFLLENLRFYKEEEENDLEFAKKLAGLADIYVNDAFAASHRDHASITGVAELLPHFAGLRLQEEIKALSKVLENPKRPLVALIGGVKIETKLPLVERMHHFADYVLVGGKIAQEIHELLKIQHETTTGQKSTLLIADCNKEKTDITEESRENFIQIINTAKTIVWNGPVGKISNMEYQISNIQKGNSEYGTLKLAEGITKCDAYKIAGGGDTTEFLKRVGLINKFNFVSIGGGAMLTFLAGEKMPGLEVLTNSN